MWVMEFKEPVCTSDDDTYIHFWVTILFGNLVRKAANLRAFIFFGGGGSGGFPSLLLAEYLVLDNYVYSDFTSTSGYLFRLLHRCALTRKESEHLGSKLLGSNIYY